MWFVVHLDDVRSDFSVYHRVDDLESMPADRFLAFLPRIAVYDGAVAFTARGASQPVEREPEPPAPAEQQPMVDIRHAMANDPLFMGLGTAVSVPAT